MAVEAPRAERNNIRGFGQDRDVSQSVAFRAPFPASGSSSKSNQSQTITDHPSHPNVIFIASHISSHLTVTGPSFFFSLLEKAEIFLLNPEFKHALRYVVLYPFGDIAGRAARAEMLMLIML